MSFSHHPKRNWAPEKWLRDWTERYGPLTPEQQKHSNGIQSFRLALAAKEPKIDICPTCGVRHE